MCLLTASSAPLSSTPADGVARKFEPQKPATWAKIIGGKWSGDVRALKRTEDDGYVLLAGMARFQSPQLLEHGHIWLIRMNRNMEIEWQREYRRGWWDSPGDIQEVPGGGFVIAGDSGYETSTEDDDAWDPWIFRIGQDGGLIWNRVHPAEGSTSAEAVRPWSDGGYLATGATGINVYAGGSFMWLLKVGKSGEMKWQKTYQAWGDSGGVEILPDQQGGAWIGGTVQTQTKNLDFWLLHVDSSGGILGQKAYGEGADDVAYAFRRTRDGGIVAAGRTASYSGDRPYDHGGAWVIKFDSNGKVEWQKAFIGEGEPLAKSIEESPDGGYVVVGSARSTPGGPWGDIWLARLDKAGDLIWQRRFAGSHKDIGEAVLPTPDGGYLLAGVVSSQSDDGKDLILLKLDGNGEVRGCPPDFQDVPAKTRAITTEAGSQDTSLQARAVGVVPTERPKHEKAGSTKIVASVRYLCTGNSR